ncbi:MAG: ABC transporter ATP-binding protein [Candidatus Magasanikbacteria bacterium]|jgi:branched-chain amino acid transport system ATP-binding protein|nr:ABC transporter ATP-binding protein [Candidatus Magasanikbacteria bacterium]MBT4221138.1 ABC transporter ATP-binding protein [Candidatus Magasanikbacteria bacterium]MBT4350292.1 ABC transporter ATP-binding protein [Candidatus Magasanikbacteria bacterium]MBT4541718.1 ABC transporter ATP-binding protein [Candidatus Magasanikbacteria bacterium]MBT6253305.1 ABC transporter ATP-binding protein [Candidatus Magasanikbacteria bacterium]
MLLEVKNIKKSFGGVKAIKGSTFNIEEKRITALIGPNGAGKTTLFNIITGLLKADEGEIQFRGETITQLKPHDIANFGISRTFQQVRLFRYLSVYDHLRMVENNEDTKIIKNIFKKDKRKVDIYEKILKDIGIDRGIDTLVSELSYGQRKLLNIAMALRKPHHLLMLDEPVAGVNTVVQEKIEELLQSLKEKGETILLIDHDMGFVRTLADHVIVLDAGVVITQGKPEEVLNDPKVLEAYLGE